MAGGSQSEWSIRLSHLRRRFTSSAFFCRDILLRFGNEKGFSIGLKNFLDQIFRQQNVTYIRLRPYMLPEFLK